VKIAPFFIKTLKKSKNRKIPHIDGLIQSIPLIVVFKGKNAVFKAVLGGFWRGGLVKIGIIVYNVNVPNSTSKEQFSTARRKCFSGRFFCWYNSKGKGSE